MIDNQNLDRTHRRTGGHRWNVTNDYCLMCEMPRSRYDNTRAPCPGQPPPDDERLSIPRSLLSSGRSSES